MGNDPGRVAEEYAIRHRYFNVIGSGPFLVAAADPSRVYLLFASIRGGVAVLQPSPDMLPVESPDFPCGVVLNVNAHLRFRLCDDGPLVQCEWYAWDPTGVPQTPGTTLIEVIECYKINPSGK